MQKEYLEMNDEMAKEWGKNSFGDWLSNIQDQQNFPDTPAEKFFRFYTQGIHLTINRVLRSGCNIEKYCEDSFLDPEMIYDAIFEMKKHPINIDVVTYRYLDRYMIKKMKAWSGCKFLHKNAIIFDRGFLSTTLTPYGGSVPTRHYSSIRNLLLKIYIPKGTPCAYMDLISDMDENELLFPPTIKLRILSLSIFSRIIECVIVNE